MHRFRLPLLALCLVFAGLAFAYEEPLDGGVLTSTGTSVNNTTTAVPFALAKGGAYVVQCDAAACVHAGLGSSTVSSCTMSSTSYGTQIQSGQLYDVPLVSSGTLQADTLSMVSVSGTANCRVQRIVTP